MNLSHRHNSQPAKHEIVDDVIAGGGKRTEGGAPHVHLMSADGDAHYLYIAFGLIVGFMAVEVVTAVLSGSLALLADAGHMFVDAGALGASLWAIYLAKRPAGEVWTYGFKRAEILSAAGNGIALVIIGVLVAFESIHRLIHPSNVDGSFVVIVALAGIVVNVAAAWVLAKANRSNLNIEGSYRHVLTDLYAFIATAIAGIVILTVGFIRADAIASLVVVVLMVRSAWILLSASGRVLLEAAPDNVNLNEVREHLLTTVHVIDIHDLHAWTVASSLPALSAHIVVEDICFSDGHAPQILDQLQRCLFEHFDVEHCTFQLEPAQHLNHELGTH